MLFIQFNDVQKAQCSDLLGVLLRTLQDQNETV